ncbi:hypothetical protein [Actinokineospora sp.]|uniref:hypothetical protein n=1 Tax=Actinokineospora sp. TaxID=1872133 RepID=UPI004037F028
MRIIVPFSGFVRILLVAFVVGILVGVYLRAEMSTQRHQVVQFDDADPGLNV